ncbi:MAG: hypothetical protein Q7T57_08070 [Dehalococcoidales bacterium]|nr:hypothetical protein [Dehalococcoidales bacterium]
MFNCKLNTVSLSRLQEWQLQRGRSKFSSGRLLASWRVRNNALLLIMNWLDRLLSILLRVSI